MNITISKLFVDVMYILCYIGIVNIHQERKGLFMLKNNTISIIKQLKNMLVVVLSVSMMVSMLSRPVYALEDNHISNTVNTTSEDFEKDHVNVFDNQYDSLNEHILLHMTILVIHLFIMIINNLHGVLES